MIKLIKSLFPFCILQIRGYFQHQYTTPFYIQLSEYLFQYTQIHFFFFKLFSYSPSYKSLYLMFEVIRI